MWVATEPLPYPTKLGTGTNREEQQRGPRERQPVDCAVYCRVIEAARGSDHEAREEWGNDYYALPAFEGQEADAEAAHD